MKSFPPHLPGPALVAALALLVTDAALAAGKCDLRLQRQLQGSAEGYEDCLKVTEAGRCPVDWKSDERYLANMDKVCAGRPELARARKGFVAAKQHVEALRKAATAAHEARVADLAEVKELIGSLTKKLGSQDDLTYRRPKRRSERDAIREVAFADLAHQAAVEELAELERGLEGLRGKQGGASVSGSTERLVATWKKTLAEERAFFLAERASRERLVTAAGGFTAEDSRSPAKVAEAFARLAGTHLLESSAAGTDDRPLFNFSPESRRRLPAPLTRTAPAKPKYVWVWGVNVMWDVAVNVEPWHQMDLAEGTPLLAWSLSADEESFLAVTPDGGRYWAPLTVVREGTRLPVAKASSGARLRFSPLQNLFPYFVEFVESRAPFGDVAASAFSRIAGEREKLKACHEKISRRFDKEIIPLEALHEDLVSRGKVSESVWRKIEKLREREDAEHKRGCLRHNEALVNAVSKAQVEYRKAREQAWKRTSKALAIEALP